MIYIVNINDKVYEVEVEKGKANIIKTTQAVLKDPVVETAITEVNSSPAKVSVSSNNGNGEPIKSPMPGTVLDVKVNVGTKVKKGQLLIVLEAMKMENEIFAPFEGTVTYINVTKGSTVSTNDIMMALQ